jgi:hypothetical protein
MSCAPLVNVSTQDVVLRVSGGVRLSGRLMGRPLQLTRRIPGLLRNHLREVVNGPPRRCKVMFPDTFPPGPVRDEQIKCHFGFRKDWMESAKSKSSNGRCSTSPGTIAPGRVAAEMHEVPVSCLVKIRHNNT